MNRLKSMTCYLCGAMDRVPDGGEGWREWITPHLYDLGIGVYNPCNKPSDFAPEDESTRNAIHYYKEVGNYNKVAEIMKPICAVDLRMVDIAHFLIMSLDVDVHMCGSYHEAFMAVFQKKPVLIMCEQGKDNLPNWLFGVIPHELIFSNWADLLSYLREIDSLEKVDHLDRWRFFDFNKVYGVADGATT